MDLTAQEDVDAETNSIMVYITTITPTQFELRATPRDAPFLWVVIVGRKSFFGVDVVFRSLVPRVLRYAELAAGRA